MEKCLQEAEVLMKQGGYFEGGEKEWGGEVSFPDLEGEDQGRRGDVFFHLYFKLQTKFKLFF